MIQSHNDKSTKNKERYTSDLRRLWLCTIINTAVNIQEIYAGEMNLFCLVFELCVAFLKVLTNK